MFSVFKDLTNQFTRETKPVVSSWVFHAMRLSMLMTMMACLLVTAKTHIGDNINCISGINEDQKQEHKAIETYCFIASTFTLVNLSQVSVHPGVGSIGSDTALTRALHVSSGGEEDDLRRHAYYQWVPLVLLFQTAIYYLPWMFWKRIDKGFFGYMICELDKVHLTDVKDYVDKSVFYVASTFSNHTVYAVSFFLVEILALAFAISNLFFTNSFLGGEFFSFGTSALSYLGNDAFSHNNPLNEVFPKVTKCTWAKFGPSGTIQVYDSMCVLPLNIVNEKTYIFLWVVYITTAVVVGLVLLSHLLLLILRPLRNWVLIFNTKGNQAKQNLRVLLPRCNYGDWFLLYHVQCNMVYFNQWLATLRKEVISEMK